jgi:hypothetical protein
VEKHGLPRELAKALVHLSGYHFTQSFIDLCKRKDFQEAFADSLFNSNCKEIAIFGLLEGVNPSAQGWFTITGPHNNILTPCSGRKQRLSLVRTER